MPSKKAVYFDDPASDAGQEDANGSRSGSSPGEGVEGEVQQLAGKDNRNVFIWKTTVMIIIGFAGALVSTGIFFYLKLQEQHEIRDSFDLFANTIEDVAQIQVQALFDSSRAFSRTITAEARALGMTWPFVTLSDFEVAGHAARISSRTEVMAFLPIVEDADLAEFNGYTLQNEGWLEESRQFAREITGEDVEGGPVQMLPFVYDITIDLESGEQSFAPSFGQEDYAPVWQMTPPPPDGFLLKSNLNNIIAADLQAGTGDAEQGTLIEMAKRVRDVTLSPPSSATSLYADALIGEQQHRDIHSVAPRDGRTSQPHSYVVASVFDSFDQESREVVGLVVALFSLDSFLINLLPDGVRGVFVVVKDTCGQVMTFKLEGNTASFMGDGDLSDPSYHDQERKIVFDSFYENLDVHLPENGSCVYAFHVYPSDEFEHIFKTEIPIVFACVVAAIFLGMAVAFYVYDTFVRRRNDKVMTAAVRSTAIVSSLFPSTVRDRLYDEVKSSSDRVGTSRAKLRHFVGNDEFGEEDNDAVILESKPIADLFPDTTVMFADIAGFTAWSSVREPSQVFTLLETVYRAFDRIAKQRQVFKVETIGDCYVAVCGCPSPMKNHQVTMARFALECMQTMDVLTKRLETTLGPDTAELNMRMGLHSGPVTAGVLRGERARFQLFGDTVNTAARMESTGTKGRIQVSEETADLLVAAGKQHWLLRRAEPVHAKGKGSLQTYWLVDDKASSDSKSNTKAGAIGNEPTASVNAINDLKTGRLINWNMEVMTRLLKKVVARRIGSDQGGSSVPRSVEFEMDNRCWGSAMAEVKEIIALPTFDPASQKKEPDADSLELGALVKEELHSFVTCIANFYKNNPFHNYEHASHVTMSVVKLLSRIVVPTDDCYDNDGNANAASVMHDHTYGITSDPLTQFACVLSALIHDADHPGVPNAQLVKEETQLAVFYENHSVAEQNSIDLAWNLLMDDSFKNLRTAIYGTEAEMIRFRQLVVNSVMATDIMDKELKTLRNSRWDRAFSENPTGNARDAVNRKATIVIEHLIQASDVAHTMQHWHIYRKWNERFFMECHSAYKAGRGGANPADGWYKGELGFFDFYIIPLAKKLKECGVFGVASDEYLAYAVKNRQEWKTRGQEIVAAMVEKVNGHGV